MNHYQVIVGNIGVVHSGSLLREAVREYEEYKMLSKKCYGKAAQEIVILMNGESIVAEYIPERIVNEVC